VEDERATVIAGVPTMFILLLNKKGSHDLSTLRKGFSSGSHCPVDLFHKIKKEMNVNFFISSLGMTETGFSFMTDFDMSDELRASTSGTVLPHTEAKIVDSNGKTVAVNTPGEICVRGFGQMIEYWNQAEKSKEIFDEEGFIHTGDMGEIDEHGYCRVVGRIKDIIIRGGVNIIPTEIEEVLASIPSVAGGVAVGVPDATYGESICACIILKPKAKLSEEEVKEHCKQKLAHFKIPKYVLFVESFPLTPTNKVQKYILREWSTNKLGLNA